MAQDIISMLLLGFFAGLGWRAANASYDRIAEWALNAYWWVVDKIRGLRA